MHKVKGQELGWNHPFTHLIQAADIIMTVTGDSTEHKSPTRQEYPCMGKALKKERPWGHDNATLPLESDKTDSKPCIHHLIAGKPRGTSLTSLCLNSYL